MAITKTIPAGTVPVIYDSMGKQNHLLIAGKTGSGKSVVINGIIYTLIREYFPNECRFIFLDPKRVELNMYKRLPHCLIYSSEQTDMIKALEKSLAIIEKRYKSMQKQRIRKYTAGAVYIIIDELADLMTTCRKNVLPLLQRIAQIGRAANVHIIAATQCPLTVVIPTQLKVNFDTILGLKTATRQHSRNIIDRPGCELLPPYGKGYYITPAGISLESLPLITDQEIVKTVHHWTR